MPTEPVPPKKRILSAAARLFRLRGFPAASIRDVAAEASLGASSLYNHFDSKQALLHEICFSSAEAFDIGLRTVETGATGFAERLTGIIRVHVDLALGRPETVTVFNDEWRHLEDQALQLFLAKRKAYEQRIVHLLELEVPHRNAEPRSVPADVAVATFLASLSWVYGLRDPSRYEAEALTKQIYTLWANAWQ